MDISNPEVKTASLKLLSLTRRKLTFHWNGWRGISPTAH